MNFCTLGLAVIETEAQAVFELLKRIDARFDAACELLLACKGRIVVTGMGKSGHIANKLASTFSSTGSPAFFMHPGEARTMVLDPELMMYDEPFTGQDPISMGVLVRLIKRLNELLYTTTIIVSHDVEETCSIADYVYLISCGKIIGQGTPQELKLSMDPQVTQFMKGEADGVVPFHYPAKPYTQELLDA